MRITWSEPSRFQQTTKRLGNTSQSKNTRSPPMLSSSSEYASVSSGPDVNFISETSFMQRADWFVELFANAMTFGRMSRRSYWRPSEYASSRIFLMKSMDGFVAGWISLRRLRITSARRAFSLLTLSSLITLSSFSGSPVEIWAIGALWHLITFRRSDECPGKVLTSIPSEYTELSSDASPS